MLRCYYNSDITGGVSQLPNNLRKLLAILDLSFDVASMRKYGAMNLRLWIMRQSLESPPEPSPQTIIIMCYTPILIH